MKKLDKVLEIFNNKELKEKQYNNKKLRIKREQCVNK